MCTGLAEAQRAGRPDAVGAAGHNGGLGQRFAPAHLSRLANLGEGVLSPDRLLDVNVLGHESFVRSLGPRLASK